ncbi:hypothetical protein K1W69_14850 [Hoeflea sp. WL0058]|uniref:Uncharacterized protein n=1 Tax=Flavimaribacter sediminis TaxID=2865987 RepID=A0AAE2ZQ79_9HYPH|nr:hypothetical protein [Flavimaribacter sediminis]MBW8638473.1 hypothetical protein [Flavimaribacter sediminis]
MFADITKVEIARETALPKWTPPSPYNLTRIIRAAIAFSCTGVSAKQSLGGRWFLHHVGTVEHYKPFKQRSLAE